MARNVQQWPRGEVKVAMIGLVERIVDSKGTDVALDPVILERMAACANAVTDIWFPAAHIGRCVELLKELRELRDAAVLLRDKGRSASGLSIERNPTPQSSTRPQVAPEAKRPHAFGPYHVEVIGEVYRLLDENGQDMLRHPGAVQRVADVLNAFRKVADPVEYRTAIETDCRRLESQRRTAWDEYEALSTRTDMAA